MKQYLDLLQLILDKGVCKSDRTGTGTISLFGHQHRCDLSEGFPLLTTKRLHWKSIAGELIWMLSGSTNNNDLRKLGVTIWDEWAKEDGDLGPIYGKQWRNWEQPIRVTSLEEKPTDVPYFPPHPSSKTVAWQPHNIDQITWLIEELRNNPSSRRLVVSAWNVADIPKMSLAPCHALFQFNTRPLSITEHMAEQIRVEEDYQILKKLGVDAKKEEVPEYYLDCQLYQRSCDVFLGVPYNTASYALLTHMVAQQVNMVPGEFIHTFGDVHIYRNHIDQVKKQLSREPFALPTLMLTKRDSIFDYTLEDCRIDGYYSHPSIKAEVAV